MLIVLFKNFLNFDVFLYLKVVLISTNSAYCKLPVSFSWGNVCILVVVEGYLSMCYQ